MRRVINNLSYDTKTAEYLFSCTNGKREGSSEFYQEHLYRKRTGEFFLYGMGEKDSKYAKSVGGNEWDRGELIIPLDYASAQQWASENLEPSAYDKLFGELKEDSDAIRPFLYLQISQIAYQKLNRLVSIKKITKAELIEKLIADAE